MDASEKHLLVYQPILNAPVEDVWQAITDAQKMVQWYFPTMESFTPEVGFTTEFDVVHPESGVHYLHRWTVTEAIPMRKLAYEWKYPDYPGKGLLTFELHPDEGKTRLQLTFKVLESFDPSKNPELSMVNFNAGWTHFTNALAAFVKR